MDTPNPADEVKVPEPQQPAPPAESMEPPAAPSEAPAAPYGAPAVPPPVKPKLKTNVGMFILGLATPFAVGGAVILLANLPNAVSRVFGIAVPWVLMLMFFGMLYFMIAGKKAGDAKLHSFGKGGLWAFASIPLFLLLAFGTCLVGGLGV